VSGSRTSSRLQPYPVQHPNRPPGRIRLNVRVSLSCQPDIGMPLQFPDRERIGAAVQ